ncbi:MAG: hypothetical protein KJP23_00935 [Deltaproteobacteria bacterium]|nr:hypothetical protein [Deltaproteobacteria bacterium]
MPFKKNVFGFVIFVALVLIVQGCGGSSNNPLNSAATYKYYLKNNIHAQVGARDTKASYANWTDPGAGHIIIPVNTPVEIGKFRKGLVIKNMTDGRKIFFEFNSRNMGMSVDEYIQLIASSTSVSLEKLSNIDRKGIKEGKVYAGMTKQGVRVALGYPAAHRTPSLEDNIWIYWQNRFQTKLVEFDHGGKVTQIR